MASPEFIRQVAAANDIVDVIQGYFPLQRAGSNFKALSPFSQERTPSFYVSPSKQAFYCFSSQQGGDVFKFVQLYENIAFPEALRKLAERAGIPFEDSGYDPEMAAQQRRIAQLRDLHRQSRDFFHQLLLKSPTAAAARDYLKSRSIGIEIARSWKLGYAPENAQEFLRWARETGFRDDLLLEGGLAHRSENSSRIYPHFRHRLMFPVANDYGETIAFSGRVLSPEQKGGKYINSPETPIFQKSKQFFGFDKSKQPILKAGFAILCEGQLDLITAFEAGVQNIVAPLGTAFTEGHARLLRRHTGEVVLCFDADRAGFNAAQKTFAALVRTGILVRVATLPAGEDPDSLIRQQGADAFKTIIAQAPDYFEAQIARRMPNTASASIKDRVQVAESLAEEVALVEDTMQRGLLVERISSHLGIPSQDLARICEEARKREAQQSRSPRPDARRQPPSSPAAANLYPKTHLVQVLCRVLLSSQEARLWLQTNGDRTILSTVPDTELLSLLWDASFDPENAASRSAYFRNLPEPAQNAISRLLMDEGPNPSPELAQDCYLSLVRKSLRNRYGERQARLRAPVESEEALLALLQEIAQLETQLRELPPPRTLQESV